MTTKQIINFQCELTSNGQRQKLEIIKKENKNKDLRIFRIIGDARNAWRKFSKNKNSKNK